MCMRVVIDIIIDNRGREAPGIGVLKFSHVLSAPRPQDDATNFQSKTSTADLNFLSRDYETAGREKNSILRVFQASAAAPLLDDGLIEQNKPPYRLQNIYR